MTRGELRERIFALFGVRGDLPFEDDPTTEVFRHSDSGKWFAILMNIEGKKLSPEKSGRAEVVNLKCAPEVIDSLAQIEKGIYRAYHMNKTHWLSLCLEECDCETVDWLLGASFELTKKKKRK